MEMMVSVYHEETHCQPVTLILVLVLVLVDLVLVLETLKRGDSDLSLSLSTRETLCVIYREHLLVYTRYTGRASLNLSLYMTGN